MHWRGKIIPYKEWNRWFAWHPVTMSTGDEWETIWLEYVERKMISDGDGGDGPPTYQYRRAVG